ncbi:consortin isoform 1 [Camelus ferus]|nr:consortin isoform 1 [Camelus ferus]
MDDSETPTYNLQIEPQDERHPDDSVGSIVTCLPSASDENENQLDGDGHELLTSSDSAMGKPEVFEQDSLNNNESCTPSCEVDASENSENTSCEGARDGPAFLGKDQKTPGKRSSRSKRGTVKKLSQGLSSGDTIPLMQGSTLPAAPHAVRDEESAEVNANDQLEAPKLVLQSLFSLIRGEVEELDSRALPLCLHQIFYSDEKAMKFIQLERLYHEQLLANLSAIQEQWESETCLGMESGKESQHKEETRESSPCCNQMARQADPPSLPVTAAKDHTEEPLCSAEATLELHAQPLESAGSRSGPHSSGSAYEDDSRLPLAQTEACQDVAEIESIAEDPKVCSESVIEPLILPGSGNIPPVLISEGKYSQTQRKELRLLLQDASEALPTDQPEDNELNELQQPDLTGGDGKSPQGQTDSEGSESVLCENNKVSDLDTVLPEVYMAPEEQGDKDDQVSKETEDYLNSLLEGCLKDTEDSLPYDDNQEEDSDLLQDLSPEEASYSLQESLSSDESCLSLDDLAKRIEIAEVYLSHGKQNRGGHNLELSDGEKDDNPKLLPGCIIVGSEIATMFFLEDGFPPQSSLLLLQL